MEAGNAEVSYTASQPGHNAYSVPVSTHVALRFVISLHRISSMQPLTPRCLTLLAFHYQASVLIYYSTPCKTSIDPAIFFSPLVVSLSYRSAGCSFSLKARSTATRVAETMG